MKLSKLKLIFSLAVMASCMLFFMACEKDNENDPTPVPSISGFSPASGAEGETVIILGKNFSEKEADNAVKFNGTAASVTEATTTKLTVTVPEGATTGKITVSVGGELATSKNDFIVLQAPVVNSFSPESGKAGDEVTISGENFSEKAEENTVKFGSIAATVKTATTTKLTVIVPEEAATGKITVSVDGRSATSENNFTVINSPKINGFAPSSGMVGDEVTISGENFSAELTENTVKIGELTAQVIEASTTQLKIKIPEGAVTESIYVTVNGQTASTGDATFKVLYKPFIYGFSPKSGPVGTSITITGEHFSTVLEENVVEIGLSSSLTLAKVTAATPTELTVTVQEGTTTGYVHVAVNGLSATAIEKYFQVLVPPVISSFSPSGYVGDEVTITGENFSTTASENIVEFNGVTATVSSASATSLTVTVPEGATTGKITVTKDGLTATSTEDFKVWYPPVISSFSPASGFEGETVTITGENFSTTTYQNIVKFNGIAAIVLSASATSLSVKIPTGATSGKITVKVNEETATSTEDFTILYPPVISSFSPTSGYEGVEVIITGENFSTTASENVVEFRGVAATVLSASATSLTVKVPAGATTGKITVATNGYLYVSEESFTVEVAPSVNYALGATVHASSTYGSYSPDNINDGDTEVTPSSDHSWTNDFYAPDGKLPQWIALDLGEVKEFTKIVLYTSIGYEMQDYQIQYWDGDGYVDIESVVGNTNTTNTYNFEAIQSRYVRVYATKGSTTQAWFARVNELEVWGK